MSTPAQPRLPLEDLLRLVNTFDAVASRVGVAKKTVYRWREEGGVPLNAADRAAVRLGFHPSDVWGQAWWEACDAVRARDLAFAERVETRRARAEIVRGYMRVERARDRREAAEERAVVEAA